ncbi:MAG: glycoside hydrolase family 3 C-terminal domain-containing protein [Candidatus Izemoplasmatales bacterium]
MDIAKLLKELTLEEKCGLLVGADMWHTRAIPRLKIPSVMMADGPTGLRKQLDSRTGVQEAETYHAVCYPPAATVAASFDVDVAERVGRAIASECRAKDVQAILAPGVNIKRSPLCGRNFEYYSEDPLVSGELGAAFVRGVQSEGVGACVKHYALNSQESWRMTSDSVADPRAFREIYARAFERVVRERPAMVMCSYNRVDGVYAAENAHLLDATLRRRFGFDGLLVSDWGAVSDRTRSVRATLDLEMPGHAYAVRKLIKDYRKGRVTDAELDACVERVLRFVDAHADLPVRDVDLDGNHELARQAAAAAVVLLKNDGDVLPLKTTDRVAVLGALAERVRIQGGGSSHVNPHKVDSILETMPQGASYEYAAGYALSGDGYSQGLLDVAKEACRGKDKVVIFAGLTDEYESEGYDRTDLGLPFGHEELIRQVAEIADKVIVVLTAGSPVAMPWIKNVQSVVNAYLPGEAGAGAVVDVLYGAVNPSGRLPETWPLRAEDVPCASRYAAGNAKAYYQESVYVGYRYYQTKNVPVLFPFGYGLSYASFAYSDLRTSRPSITIPGDVEVAVEVENIGSVFGREVVQLYVENAPGPVFRPRRELRRFAKIGLAPGERKTVSFSLGEADFAYFDPRADRFVARPGTYRIAIMRHAAETILSIPLEVVVPDCPEPDPAILGATSYDVARGLIMTDEDFAILIGRRLEPTAVRRRRPYTMDDTLEDVSRTLLGKLLVRFARGAVTKAVAHETESYRRMVTRSLMETPLRSMSVMSGGMLPMRTALALVDLMNLRPDRAVSRLFGRD